MSKLLIFDADSVIFIVAWQFRTKKISNMVKLSTNKFISDVLRHANADDYLGFYALKNENDETKIKPNFRYAVYDKYKANRPETPDFVHKWRPVIHTEFKDTWGFVGVQGLEADDAVAIAVEKYRSKYDEIIIATFDKDLKTVPGITFYNMKDHTMQFINEFEAASNFYKQMLMGDSGDNIPGIKGVGKVAANNILKNCSSIYGLFRTTAKTYRDTAKKIEDKELSVIKSEVDTFLTYEASFDQTSPYKGLTGNKLKRKIRIVSKQRLKEKVDEIMPGGWKVYFKQQYTLLRMLTEENEDITIQNVLPNPVKYDVPETDQDVVKAVFGEEIDSFLTV